MADNAEFTVEPLLDRIYAGDRVLLRATVKLSNGERLIVTPEAAIAIAAEEQAEIATENGKTLLLAKTAGTVELRAAYKGLQAVVQVEVMPVRPAKARSSYFTAEKVSAARANIGQFGWAADTKKLAVGKADKWLCDFSLGELWEMVPSQNIPRSYAVNQLDGGLACANEIKPYGNYPYRFSVTEVDWKLTSPVCGVQFPTNHFKAYYEGGLDEYGRFDPALAKRHNDELIAKGETGNLVNRIREQIAANPSIAHYVTDAQIMDPDWGVDDGMGYRFDPNDTLAYGRPYTFVAYYAHWALWYNGGMIKTALKDFSEAYLFTGEQRYADAALVLLDRIGDLYPDMQVSQFPHSAVSGYRHYGFLPSDGWHFYPGRGKIVGSIWENELMKAVMYAYDAVFPAIGTLGAEASEVLNAKAYSENKSKPDRMKANFEDGVLREICTAYKAGDLQGNPGMHQSTLALAAVVLDHDPETSEMLNFGFRSGASDWKDDVKTGGNIMNILVDDVSHDGHGDESAPLYNSLWLSNWLEVAKMLDGYELPEGGTLEGGVDADLFKNPRFRKMFMAMYPLLLTSHYTPNIGDSGQTGNPDVSAIRLDELIEGYSRYGKDELAQAIYLLNGKTAGGIALDIFSDNPNAVSQKIRRVIEEKGELRLGSENFSGYGLAVLRDGFDLSGSMNNELDDALQQTADETAARTTQRALWMYYGGTASHAHGDPLNLGYIAYDLDLMPDLGYPDTSSDDLAFFPRTTRSHNTVMVNGLPVDAFGEPTNFDDSGFVKLASVDANGVAGLSNAPDGLYKRTTALIRINEEDSYIVDLFDLNGGLNYEYSFHSGESESANTVYQGLELSTSGADELSLKNFRKDANGTSGAFSVDWNLKDTYNRYGHGAGAVTDVHLKMTMLGDYDEVTIADGIPPQNSLTNPKRLEYIFVKSNDSRTVYTSVIEPYRGASSIASIERLPVVENNGAAADPAVVKALRVAFKDGRTDFIVQSLDASMVYTVAGKFAFSGFFGVYSEQDGKLVRAYLHEGTRLGGLVNGTPAVKGFVAGRTDTLAVENFIDLSVALPIEPALLIGKYIYIDNDADVNAVYRIEGASRHDDHIRLHIGDVSVVNAWRDSADFSQGYAFSFEPGDAFRIPLSLSKRYAEGIGDDGYPKPASAAPE